jgi:hypothetical protein
MQRQKILIQRIPLEEVLRLVREEKTPESSEDQFGDLDVAKQAPATKQPYTNGAQKQHAVGKPSRSTEAGDRSLGLWINKDMLRRHQHQQARIILHDPRASNNNRYLALADLALNNRRQSGSKNAKNEDAKNEDAKNAARIR